MNFLDKIRNINISILEQSDTIITNDLLFSLDDTSRGQTFMKSIKNDQFCDFPHSEPQKWTIDILFKNNRTHKRVKNLKIPSPPLRGDVLNVWSVTLF